MQKTKVMKTNCHSSFEIRSWHSDLRKCFKLLTVAVSVLLFQTMLADSGTQPRFTNIQVANYSVTLTLAGIPLTAYTILGTTDVAAPITNIVGVVVTDANGVGSFTDVGTLLLNPQKFYRAQQTP